MDLEDLDDRVAVVGPDEAFIEKLREPLARALGGFELVDAATASAVLLRGDTEARAADAKQLLVVDSVDNMDGLERLVIICVGLVKGHLSTVNCVAVFPDGRRVVSGSRDYTLKVWDLATGECVATLKGHSYGVYGVAVFPDGRRVVSGSMDKTLKVWDVATGKCVATLKGHSSSVWGVAVFPDGRRVVSASEDTTLELWGLPES